MLNFEYDQGQIVRPRSLKPPKIHISHFSKTRLTLKNNRLSFKHIYFQMTHYWAALWHRAYKYQIYFSRSNAMSKRSNYVFFFRFQWPLTSIWPWLRGIHFFSLGLKYSLKYTIFEKGGPKKTIFFFQGQILGQKGQIFDFLTIEWPLT